MSINPSKETVVSGVFRGIPASPGIVIGHVHLIERSYRTPKANTLSESQIDSEIARFEAAIEKARQHINELKIKAEESLENGDHAKIFDAHLLILEDPSLIDGTINRIRSEQVNAEKIFYELFKSIVERLSKVDNPYFRERTADIEEVGHLIMNLLGEVEASKPRPLPPDAIVVAHDLGPGQTVSMSHESVRGFAINVGGATSHTAIMAQALKIPAVVGTSNLTKFARNGDTIIVDGEEGVVVLNPTDEQINEFELKDYYLREVEIELSKLKEVPAETRDGHVVELSANVEIEEELGNVLASGADGIGLYRTEFLFVNTETPPTEDEQFKVYRNIAETMGQKPVIFRTLDVGGDKFASSMPIEKELNPFLGLRAIRLYRQYPDIFRNQLRALLRASVYGKVKIMFPMVCLIEELSFGIETIRQEMAALEFNTIPFDPNIEIGIMIETPAAAAISDLLARKANFFSIGTNDLIQYTLAVDRNNQNVTNLYEPFHPSVLRTIKQVIDAAHENGIWVGLCGEMAGDPYGAALLVGLGIDELSMGPVNIPTVKKMLRNLNASDVSDLAREVLECGSASEVRERLFNAIHRLYVPDEWLSASN